MGRSDVEGALKKLDDLTNEETWMAIAEPVSTTRIVAVDADQVIRSSFANLVGSDRGCLTRPCRKPIVGQPSQITLPTRPVHEP